MLRALTRFSKTSYSQNLRLCGRPPESIMSQNQGDMGSQPPKRSKVITLDTMNPLVKKMEYAVRGPIVARASAIEKELESVSWKGLLYINKKLLKKKKRTNDNNEIENLSRCRNKTQCLILSRKCSHELKSKTYIDLQRAINSFSYTQAIHSSNI